MEGVWFQSGVGFCTDVHMSRSGCAEVCMRGRAIAVGTALCQKGISCIAAQTTTFESQV